MKHLRQSLCFCLSLIVLASCNDEPEPVSRIVGKWKVTTVQSQAVNTEVTISQYLIQNGISQSEATGYDQSVINLFAGEYINATVSFNASGTWSISTGSVGTWKISDDEKTLYLTAGQSPGVDFVYTITLTDSQLEIAIPVPGGYMNNISVAGSKVLVKTGKI